MGQLSLSHALLSLHTYWRGLPTQQGTPQGEGRGGPLIPCPCQRRHPTLTMTLAVLAVLSDRHRPRPSSEQEQCCEESICGWPGIVLIPERAITPSPHT